MSEREALEKAIAALEAQRSTLGDAVVETAIAALRRQLAALPSRPSEERRQVTILFADLVGFTSLAERMDPEEVHEVLEAYFGLWKAAIGRHEGMVEKFIGDAVVAVFGLYRAHEDVPLEAVSAALEARRELEELNRQLEGRRGLRLAMRVGIHSGPVLVRYEGPPGEAAFTVTGDAVNLAARLEQSAPPGGILISHAVFQQVRGYFETAPQGPLQVRGKARPVRVYLVQGRRPAAFWPAGRGLEGLETPMVGREREFAALREAFGAVRTDAQPRIIILVGEAGVGKTRLLREFERWLLRNFTCTVFRARAASETEFIPYGLLRDLFSRQWDILESDDAARVREKFLRGMQGFLPEEQALRVGHLLGFDFSADPAVRSFLGHPSFQSLAQADLVRYVRSLAARSPVVLFLEDLHWADNSSLELLSRLREGPGSILVLASARPDLLARRPDPEGEVWALPPLSPDSCRTLAGKILRRVEALPAAVPARLAEWSGGNPYFLEELVGMLIEEGVVVPGKGRWRIRSQDWGALRVPPTLTALLQARLDALPAEEKVLLQRASVVGRDFWDEALRLLGDGEGGEVEALLERLVARGMVLKKERSALEGTREYAFRHVLLREVCYETVLLRERREYHRRVAGWLEERAGGRQREYAGRIGEHYARAGEGERAVFWFQQAGEAALQTSAFAEAVSAFERALALLPAPGEAGDRERRAALSVRLGVVYERWGKYGEAEEWLRRGLALARELGLGVEAEALCGLGLVAFWRSNYEEACSLSAEALALSRRSDDRRTMATALQCLGAIAYHQADFPLARQHLEAALALEEGGGNPWGMATCLNNLGLVHLSQGNDTLACRCYERALTLLKEIGDRRGIANCLNNLGNLALHQRNYSLAQRYYKDALNIAEEIADRQGIALSLSNLGWAALQMGEYARVVSLTEEALAIFREVGDRMGVIICLSNLGHATVRLGQEKEAKRYYLEALAEARDIQASANVLEAVAGLAGLLAGEGRCRRAAELVGLALSHPASYRDVARVAEPVLALLRECLSAEALEAALEKGRLLDLEETVRELLSGPAPGSRD